MSNEKNSSLFTQLLSDTKYIFITILSYKVLKTFVFTWKNILGVTITTLAGIIITVNSIYNNIQIKKASSNEEEKKYGKADKYEEIKYNSKSQNIVIKHEIKN